VVVSQPRRQRGCLKASLKERKEKENKMNSKKLITLLVLTTMLFAMVPMVPVAKADLTEGITFDNDDHSGWTNEGEKGHTIIIEGDPGSVASGYEVLVHWDKIQDWDGKKGHLNTTEADNDGGFEIWITVPESVGGTHYLWFTATDQETKVSEKFTVVSDCDISSSSGLQGSKVTTNFWGFKGNKDIAILFAESNVEAEWAGPLVEDEDLGDGGGIEATFTGTLIEHPIVIGSLEITDGTETFEDLGDGTLYGDGGGTGTIDYETGAYSVTFDAAPAIGDDILADYQEGFVELDEALDTGDGDETDFDGTLETSMVVPSTFKVIVGGVLIAEDDGKGSLDDTGSTTYVVDDGSINYVTGEWTVEFTDEDTLGDGDAMKASYNYYDEIDDYLFIITSAGVTNDLGSYTNRRITIPDDAAEGQYYVAGLDGKGNSATDDFLIGATIIIDIDEGPVGTVVKIEGEGFALTTPFDVFMVLGTNEIKCHVIDEDEGADSTDGTGDIEVEIVVPGVNKKSDDWEIEVRCGADTPSAGFEVTGLAEVSVDPDFGPQGSKFTVSGENYPQIKDTIVVIELWNKALDDMLGTIKNNVKTASDGTFEVEVNVPTENDAEYKIKAYAKGDADGPFDISDTVNFRIGTIMVLLSTDEGEVGEKIVLTGNGFTESDEWNATFGDIVIFEDVETDDGGRLKDGGETPAFFVPQVEPGEYIITVWDVDAELTVDVEFTVTEAIYMEFDTYNSPNNFNVTMEGWNWPEIDTGSSNPINKNEKIEWVLYNETEDWDMDVRQFCDDDSSSPPKVSKTAVFNTSGYYHAWWLVPDDDTLSKGTYWVNATVETDNDQEYFMQLEFTVGDVHESIAPRKATFRIGDTVTFNIQHSFGGQDNMHIKGGDVRFYDPDGSLYWAGDELETWSKVGMYYTVPYSAQTAGGNPMVLLDDAPLGTWTYKWREDDGDVIKEGTFNVEASEADILVGQIDNLNSAIDALTSDIKGVTDAVAGVQTNVNSAIQAANAAVEAANAAVEAVNAVAGVAGEAAEAADRAAEAAGKAQDSAGSLTTLVYGAIGASLVAALAAIVSLMQISKRIAG